MTAQAGISALQLGLPAVAPQIRDEFGLSLAATGALLAAATLGIIATLLAWGALADRIGERAVIAAGLTGAALALMVASRADSAPALGACLVAAGHLNVDHSTPRIRAPGKHACDLIAIDRATGNEGTVSKMRSGTFRREFVNCAEDQTRKERAGAVDA